MLSLINACAISKEKEVSHRSDKDAGSSVPSNKSVFGETGARSNAPDSRSDGNTDEITASSGMGGIGGSDPEIAICGNGRLEGEERCDDGNLNSRDGCTTLCEFSCSDDADCDDLNDCNGVEICTHHRACDDSDPDLDQGAECGDEKSCWQGICVQNVCGDGKRDSGEVCDAGNLDPDDGCTPDCELTCEDDSDCTDNHECLHDPVCRDDGHHGGLRVCTGGTPFEDETACEIKDVKMKTLCSDTNTIMKGIEYDVDTDSDGENDSWSVLLGFETERVRIYDVVEQ